jgi:hypothetical protein
MSIDHCRIIDFPKIADPRGNLTFIEAAVRYPLPSRGFTISMTFWAERPRSTGLA